MKQYDSKSFQFSEKPYETYWNVWYRSEVLYKSEKYFIEYLDSNQTVDYKIFNSSNKIISSGDAYDFFSDIIENIPSLFKDSEAGDVYLYEDDDVIQIHINENGNNNKIEGSNLSTEIKLSYIEKDIYLIKYFQEFIRSNNIIEGDLDLYDLEKIPELLLELISKLKGTLDLSSVQILSEQDILALSKHRGELILGGLKSIEDGVADMLSKHSGILDLNGVEEISVISAKCLSNYKGILNPENLQTISETAISSILESKGIIICQGQLFNEYRKKYADSIRYEKMFLDESNSSISYFSIVPQLGTCLDFIKNIDNKIYVVFDRKSKISITDFLQAFGFSNLDILNLFNVSFVQIRNNREDLEKELGQKFATKIYRRWVEDFIDEDTGDVFSLERSEVIFNANEELTENSIQSLLEIPIEFIFLHNDSSINSKLYFKSFAIGRASNIFEAQHLLYRSILIKDADDNQTAEEFVKSYSDGQAINLRPEARKKLNDILSITTPRANGLYLEDYIQIIKYLIAN